MLTGAVASLAAVDAPQRITFGGSGSKLVLRSPADFAGVIDGFVKGDVIELDVPATKDTSAAGGANGGVLTLTDAQGNVVAQLAMIGPYQTNDFQVTSPGVVEHA